VWCCGAVQLPLFVSPDHHCLYYAGPVIIVVTAFTMADDETDGLALPSLFLCANSFDLALTLDTTHDTHGTQRRGTRGWSTWGLPSVGSRGSRRAGRTGTSRAICPARGRAHSPTSATSGPAHPDAVTQLTSSPPKPEILIFELILDDLFDFILDLI
jgi:hypothetical protein